MEPYEYVGEEDETQRGQEEQIPEVEGTVFLVVRQWPKVKEQ